MTGRPRLRRALAVLSALAVLATLPGPALAGASGDATRSAADDWAPAGAEPVPADTLAFDYTFERLPDRPGEVQVTVTTTVPPKVTGVTVEPPEGASVVGARGYTEAEDGSEWAWERAGDGTAEATIGYTVPVNETENGSLEGVDVGDWALFDWRRTDLRWRYTRTADTAEPAVVERPAGTVGPGVVGPGFAYLGPYETETRRVDGERIRLVVPEAADLRERPAAVADALAAASADLRIGGRNERVTAFVAPAPIDVAGRLARTGGDRVDFFVAADRSLATPDNAWFHEYVHSRQEYTVGDRLRWVDDASAEYYGALLAYRQGLIGEKAFHDYVRSDRASDAVLAEAGTGDDASYFKGMRVLAAADADVRDGSGGDRTLAAVFERMNGHDGVVTQAELARFLSEAAGEPRGDWLERYVTTSASPSVPTFLDPRPEPTGLPALPTLGTALFVAAVLVTAVVLRAR